MPVPSLFVILIVAQGGLKKTTNQLKNKIQANKPEWLVFVPRKLLGKVFQDQSSVRRAANRGAEGEGFLGKRQGSFSSTSGKNSCAPAVVPDSCRELFSCVFYFRNSEEVTLCAVKRAVGTSRAVCSKETQRCS